MSHSSAKGVVRIDGSYGEGGGQILRTSLALASALGRPLEIINIRKTRQKPGLQPQHLTSVLAAAAISRAHVEGAELSSTSILFLPGALLGGNYDFNVAEKRGSAGSTSLVLQTIMLPLCFADQPANVTVHGGTHVPWCPTFHYLKFIFLPMLSRINAKIALDIKKWGWYPGGGGTVMARVIPCGEMVPIRIPNRGRLIRATGISAVANLPRDIAVRQRNRAVNALLEKGIDADMEIVDASSPGKGTLVFLKVESENSIAGFDALGAIGKRAEEVADEACQSFLTYVKEQAALDPHLADQIVPYLALARGDSVFTTSSITRHLLTNIWVVKQFLDADVQVTGKEGEAGQITISV
ncbi:MAG TPA: RNA 3'-terminal phosphate cyclase [Nitrospirota bacterium]|nr:RNA 3'-terminal phosphate cyclase [Nitrospirota bacterium]